MAGQISQTCEHCHAPLVPSRTVAELGIDAVREQVRAKRLERVRIERNATVAVQRYAVRNPLWYVAGSWGAMLCLGAVGTTVSVLAEPTVNGVEGLLALWSAVLVFAAVVFAVVGVRRSRARRWRDALDRLAGQFHGARIEGLQDTVAWLNEWWAASWEDSELRVSGTVYGAALFAYGYPALVTVDPTAPGRYGNAYATVALAAWVPGVSDGSASAPPWTAEAESIRVWLNGAGFALHCAAGALAVRASAGVVRALQSRPEFALGLSSIISQLARLARAIGATAPGR